MSLEGFICRCAEPERVQMKEGAIICRKCGLLLKPKERVFVKQ